MYYTVAYPDLSPEDTAWIHEFRRRHDLPYRDVVAAHFTLVFGISDVPETTYLRHVESVARSSHRIRFSCRYAMLGADAEDDTAYVFLVPDEGHGAISLLHDRLYRGPLAPYLRLDIPFTPHINIGTLADRREAKELCDELNDKGLAVNGTVQAVTVGILEDGPFRDVARFGLLDGPAS